MIIAETELPAERTARLHRSVGRPIRHLEPGATWFITVRCQQAMFLLRPDPVCVDRVGFWLARALERFPGIQLHAVVQMSNHLHAALRDERSELSDFMEYFLGNLARDLNELRVRSGTFFERRYSAERILDDEALCDRIVYTVANPVQSSLVQRHDDWPGLVTFSGDAQRWVFERPRKDDPEAPAEQHILELAPLPNGIHADELATRIRAHEAEVFQAKGAWCLGAQRVLDQDPLASPEHPKRSPRPLCHTTIEDLYWAFLESWRDLRARYAHASRRWRLGDHNVRFPAHTFRPHSFALA